MSTILNLDKEYKKQPFFFGEEPGIYDSINLDQEVFDLHKRAVSQFWQADEFSFAPCKGEFMEENDGRDIMIDTIKFQWLADSCAVNLYTLLQPFISNDQITQLVLFNTYLESVHSETYSEIVKNAFPDPVKTIEDLSKDETSIERLAKIQEVFAELRQAGLDFSTGVKTKGEVFASVYKGVVALYLLERVQFVCSFAVTFSLGELGRFQPVAMAVRKICADEIIIHADTDLLILKDLRTDPVFSQIYTPEFEKEIEDMVDEVIQRECNWVDKVFEGRSLPGLTPELLKEWALFNSRLVKKDLNLPVDNKHRVNPLPFLKGWITMNSLQAAPQEQSDMGQYLIGKIDNDLDNLDVDLDF